MIAFLNNNKFEFEGKIMYYINYYFRELKMEEYLEEFDHYLYELAYLQRDRKEFKTLYELRTAGIEKD